MLNVRLSEGGGGLRAFLTLASAWGALTLTQVAEAQATPSADATQRGAPGTGAAGEQKTGAAAGTAASSSAPVITPPVVSVTTGAPQPPSQNLAGPLPSTTPASPSAAVVKVGGGMILLYSNNYAPKFDGAGNEKKHIVDVWRASIVLDAKLDRYGMHIEFRARDRNLRWMPVNAWFEELYASADLIKPGSTVGPLTLKVGKVYHQFGRFWDNSFYGNIHLRDGLKLIPNWGLSFEGTLGAGKTWGAKYFAQYFVVDGQTSTANANRDTNTIAVPGVANQLLPARRREDFIVRIEPSWTKSPTMNVKLGASFQHFKADFPDTFSPAAMARMARIKDRDNMQNVMRYSIDLTAQLAWFGIWGEYSKQDGSHTNAFPYAPTAAVPATMTTPAVPARPGSASDDITYLLAGANFTYDRYTLQYNYNRADYKNIEDVTRTGTQRVEHAEWIHNPSVQVKISEQLRLIVELPFWFRQPAPGLARIDPEEARVPAGVSKREVIEQQFLMTLHGKF